MRVKPSKKIVGYLLLEDVRGKSGRPIIKQNTVLTEQHITILQKFLIDMVDVSANEFQHTANESEKKEEIVEQDEERNFKSEKRHSFYDAYLKAVSAFKNEYQKCYNGIPIDISSVRNLIMPLLNQVDKLDMEPFLLYHYGKAKDYIYYHSTAVSVLSAFIARKLGYGKGDSLQIGLIALLCNLGMTKVDQNILRKVGPLTKKQLEVIHHHPIYTYRMIENLPTITQIGKQAILQHHERMDGSGYPSGLKGNAIHPYARIIAVCDTYYAMVSPRLYKEKQFIFKAVEEIYKEQFVKFDVEVVKKFIDTFVKKSIGKKIRLSDYTVAEIIYVYEDNPSQPLVRLEETGSIISLQKYPDLLIEGFIH